MHEFDLIDRFFRRPKQDPPWVRVGIGDDGAILSTSPGSEAVVVTDTSVAGVHFNKDQSAHSIGFRALAVNLSDIAAMGATPRWITLNLTLEDATPEWVLQFADGFFQLADLYSLPLVGGDTTKGPLAVTVTVGGELPAGKGLLRGGAKENDAIFVSGPLGGAAAALKSGGEQPSLKLALEYPSPRLELGQALLGLASAAIDISDGFLGDLGHLLKTSGNLGAAIELDRIPMFAEAVEALGHEQALDLALRGGDDYELCFTVSPENLSHLNDLESTSGLRCTRVGRVTASGACQLLGKGSSRDRDETSYQHHW